MGGEAHTIGQIEVGGLPAITVGQLIAKLQELPADLAVYIESDDWTGEDGASGFTWPAREVIRRSGFPVTLLASDRKTVLDAHQVPDRIVLG